jgi:hypothetical protein
MVESPAGEGVIRAHRPPLSRSTKRIPRALSSASCMWLEWNYAARFPQPRKGRKAQGLRYERRVNEYLFNQFELFVPNLPFRYCDSSGAHVCIPDGILFRPQEVIIFEVKLTHTLKAYWELTKTYRPVVQRALGRRVRVCEITQSYDPRTPFPTGGVHRTVQSFLESSDKEGVVLWRPQ